MITCSNNHTTAWVISVFLLCSSFAVAQADRTSSPYLLQIEDFEQSQTNLMWGHKTDTILGGNSTGDIFIDEDGAHLLGNVSSIGHYGGRERGGEPGFVYMYASSSDDDSVIPDISNCEGIEILVRSNTDHGKFGFFLGTKRKSAWQSNLLIEMHGHKGFFSIPKTEQFRYQRISFSDFHEYWLKPKGHFVVKCNRKNILHCPTAVELGNINEISIWGEKEVGEVNLDIKKIFAYNCKSQQNMKKDNLFTALANILQSNNSTEEIGDEPGEESEAKEVKKDQLTPIENQIPIHFSVVALFFSLGVLFIACQMRMKLGNVKATVSRPELESKPGNAIL